MRNYKISAKTSKTNANRSASDVQWVRNLRVSYWYQSDITENGPFFL